MGRSQGCDGIVVVAEGDGEKGVGGMDVDG